MTKDLGNINELKTALDTMYQLDKAITTIKKFTGKDYTKERELAMQKAKELLEKIKKPEQ